MSSNHPTNFRKDINGLRAWAVVAVILYHFGIRWFSGGFIGVDVFFVISGYLMTGIVIGGPDDFKNKSRTFSLLEFYRARAIRIVPALAVLCLSLFVWGWFFLSAEDYHSLATHSIGALGFFSNFLYWREAGYFDVTSFDKYLLHTWSLSVEWQFYLILPLVAMTIWKFCKRRISITIAFAIAFGLSLALALFFSPLEPSAAFYLLPTRAWEMLAGGLVFLLAGSLVLPNKECKAIEFVGFALIIISVLIFDSSSNWPSGRAVVPVIGTVLVLLAKRQNSLWTGAYTVQWLGTRSYSLYLWHWPVVVVLVYLESRDGPIFIILGIVLTMILGHISYAVVENPIRFALRKLDLKFTVAILFALICIVIVPSIVIKMMGGMADRRPDKIYAQIMAEAIPNPRRNECHVSGDVPSPECTYGGSRLGAIVIGDSHANALITSIQKSFSDNDLHVLEWTRSGCRTLLGVNYIDWRGSTCGDFSAWALERQKTLPPNIPLIIINRTSVDSVGVNELTLNNNSTVPNIYFDERFVARTPQFYKQLKSSIVDTACEFAKTRPVYFVRPTPELKLNVPKVMGKALLFGYEREVTITLEEYYKRHSFVWEAQDAASKRCGVKILNPLPYLCNNLYCSGSKNGIPLYSDDNHLGESGGSVLSPMFSKIFN